MGPARVMPVIATASQSRPTSFLWRSSARARRPSPRSGRTARDGSCLVFSESVMPSTLWIAVHRHDGGKTRLSQGVRSTPRARGSGAEAGEHRSRPTGRCRPKDHNDHDGNASCSTGSRPSGRGRRADREARWSRRCVPGQRSHARARCGGTGLAVDATVIDHPDPRRSGLLFRCLDQFLVVMTRAGLEPRVVRLPGLLRAGAGPRPRRSGRCLRLPGRWQGGQHRRP